MSRLMKGLRFNAERRNYGRWVDVHLYVPLESGVTQVATSINFTHVDAGSTEPEEAPLTLTPQQAQELMDALWHCGLRPTEGTGSAGSLAATQEHLKDMRAIAFGLLRQEGELP
jgi:hypothetical protein